MNSAKNNNLQSVLRTYCYRARKNSNYSALDNSYWSEACSVNCFKDRTAELIYTVVCLIQLRTPRVKSVWSTLIGLNAINNDALSANNHCFKNQISRISTIVSYPRSSAIPVRITGFLIVKSVCYSTV